MSELARRLIAEAEADLASRLQAIEAHAGLLEEAETIASTLRHHGIDAKANGITFAAWCNHPAKCSAWVGADSADAETLLTALGAAELRIADIQPGEHRSTLRLEGLTAPLNVAPATAAAMLRRLMQSLGQIAGGASHG